MDEHWTNRRVEEPHTLPKGQGTGDLGWKLILFTGPVSLVAPIHLTGSLSYVAKRDDRNHIKMHETEDLQHCFGWRGSRGTSAFRNHLADHPMSAAHLC